jgi:hypothetical protein
MLSKRCACSSQRGDARSVASMPDQLDLASLDLRDLVAIVYADWDNVNPYAASYLHALAVNDCHELDDPVVNETAAIQVGYLLANSAGWRGATARAVKTELRRRLERPRAKPAAPRNGS